MKQVNLAFVLLFLSMSCSSKKELNNLSKVTLALSSFGTESSKFESVVYIDSSLTLNFYDNHNNIRGLSTKGTISKAVWDSVNNIFGDYLKKGLDTSEFRRTDQPTIELIILGANNQKCHYLVNTGKLSEEDNKNLIWFHRLTIQAKNLTTFDTFRYETKIQFGMIKPKF